MSTATPGAKPVENGRQDRLLDVEDPVARVVIARSPAVVAVAAGHGANLGPFAEGFGLIQESADLGDPRRREALVELTSLRLH